MATGDKTASFTVKVDAQSNAKAGADELESYRQKIESSQDAVKNYSASLRQLRGASDEVKAAKTELKAKIETERDAISRASLAVLKHGTTYEQLTKTQRVAALEARRAAAAADALKKATAETHGPLAELNEKLKAVKKYFADGTTAGGAFAVGLGIAAAAVAALVAGLVAGTMAFARFVIEGANAARTMGLMREAAGGTAANATALGHQVDALALKLATPKAELNELALTMTRAMLGTRIGGQGIVDTFNAVAQESEVMGKAAGSQIQSIIERAKTWGRMSLGMFELQGTGITFADVAKNLSKQLGISLEAAMFQLRAGYTDVNQGAKAIRTAIETRFASINLRKMLDFDVIKQKFHEFTAYLTTGVNLEPFLKGFKSLVDLFSATSMTGAALKDIVTDLGNALMGKAAGGAKLASWAIKELVIWALKADIGLLKLQRAWQKLVPAYVRERIESVSTAVSVLKSMIDGLVKAIDAITGSNFGAAGADIGRGFSAAGEGASKAFSKESLDEAAATIKGKGWGAAMGEGLMAGVRGFGPELKRELSATVDQIKGVFTGGLQMHSPSKVFEGYGRDTVEGYSGGVRSRRGDAQSAIDEMSPTAPAGGGAAPSALGRGPVSVHLEFNVHGASKPEATVTALRAPDFLAQLTKSLEDALRGAGIPTQTAEAT